MFAVAMRRRLQYKPGRTSDRGFTIVELLVVIGVIVVLAGILLPALVGARKTGQMAASMSNMKQIGIWMQQYAADNRETILPSQFDYSNNPNPGKVRTAPQSTLTIGDESKGSWSDILWTVFKLGVFPDDGDPTAADYRFDSPDNALFDKLGIDTVDHVLRSSANNTRPAPQYTDPAALPKPFGPGGDHSGYPGYFAANSFFNSTENSNDNWYKNGQIKAPDQGIYLIDSLAGEVIEDDIEPWHANMAVAESDSTCEVDFRYSGDTCLMLFLDGHTKPVGRWKNLEELWTIRKIRVQELTVRNYTPPVTPGPSGTPIDPTPPGPPSLP